MNIGFTPCLDPKKEKSNLHVMRNGTAVNMHQQHIQYREQSALQLFWMRGSSSLLKIALLSSTSQIAMPTNKEFGHDAKRAGAFGCMNSKKILNSLLLSFSDCLLFLRMVSQAVHRSDHCFTGCNY